MAQVPVYPSHIFFYAETPSQQGGATPILRSDELYARINKYHPDFIQQLKDRGVRYTRVLPAQDDPSSPIGRSWPSTFQTTDPQEASRIASTLGVDLTWNQDGTVID
jgi:hypothetical protein